MTNPVPRDKGKECWFTYVIECEDGSFYKGFTDDLLRRYQQHCNGTGADYTKTHKPKQLYYWEMHYSKEAALQREKYLKSGVGREWFKKEVVDKPENFEPASVLLEKIRQEKERLIKEKKIKRDKNASIIYRGEDNSYYEKILATGEVKCIDEEIPFEIPKGWEWCRFSSLYLSLTDGTHSTPKYTLSGIPFISVKDMSSGVIDFSNTKYISKEEHQKLSDRCHPQKGDLLLSKVGTTGIPAMVTTDREFSLFVSVALIKLIQCDINREFLVFMIQSPLVQEQAKENTRGVGNKNWVLSAVSKTLMVVPPLEEQGRIRNKLNLILPYVERYSSSQDKLDLLNANIVTDLKKSILQEAIQGKLVPQIAEEGTAQELLEQIKTDKQKFVKEGKLKKSALATSVIFRGDDNKYYTINKKETICVDDKIPFDIPNTWEWCRLGTLFSHCTGKALNASNQKGQLMSYITTSNLYWDRFELDNLKQMRFTDEEIEKCTASFGDLLVCEGGDIGRAAIWNYTYDIRIQNHIHKLRAYKQLCIKFFFWVFYFYKATGHIGGKGIGIQGLSSKALDNILIPLPPLKEQQRIVAQIEKLFEQLR